MNARSILPMKNDISQIQAIIRVVASKWDIHPDWITGTRQAATNLLCAATVHGISLPKNQLQLKPSWGVF